MIDLFLCFVSFLKGAYYALFAMDVRDFAIKCHGDQKYGTDNYVVHLDDVWNAIKSNQNLKMYNQETLRNVAYCHDILEDVKLPDLDKQIEKYYGDYVYNCVELVTDCEGHNRKTRKARTNGKLALIMFQKEALVVKIYDRLCNIRRSVAENNDSKLGMYKSEHEEFKKAVYRADMPEVSECWDEIESHLFK